MPTINDQAFVKSIRQGEFANLYMLYGKETYMLEGCLKLLLNRAVVVQKMLNLNRFDGAKCTLEEIENVTETLPVLAPRRCVVVSDLNVEKLGKNQYEQLKGIVCNLPETTVLVLAYPNTEINLRKSARYRAFSALVSKNGVLVEFSPKTQSELSKVLAKRAAKQGAELTPAASRRLIDCCGTELSRLTVELDKLAAYAGQDGVIGPEMVDELVVPSVDSSSFDLARAILQGRDQQAFSLLGELFDQRQEAITILGALNMSFIDIYRAKCAQAAGKDADAITSVFSYKGKEFRMRNSMRDASRFSPARIKRCLGILMEADVKLKSSRADNRVILETAIARMMLADAQEARG